jgi:hypothetical protein
MYIYIKTYMEKLYLDVQSFIARMYSSPRPCIIGIKRLNLHARYHSMYFLHHELIHRLGVYDGFILE